MSEAKATTKEKKPSDRDLDLSNASRGIWLVKVPKYMADKWESSDRPALIGKLNIVRKPGTKAVVSFSLDDKMTAGTVSGPSKEMKIPREHKFIVNQVQGHTLAVFSHTSGDPTASVPIPDKLSLEGKVVQRAECRPIQDNVYMDLKKRSFVESIIPKKTTQKIDGYVNTAPKPRANHIENIIADKQAKADGKKLRDDKERVLEVLFGLFEKHQYYNIKDLAKTTRQPIVYLKEILNEVCNYNMKNPHKNMWELKPEYRHYKPKQEEQSKKDGGSSSDDD